MKIGILVAAALISTVARAQTADAVPPVEQAVVPAPGKIVIYRPSSMIGLGVACPVRYKGQEIVELGRGKFAEWIVPAGRYILNNKTSSVEATVEPGGESYIRCTIKPGFMTGRADLQIVDRESFNEHAADFERKDIVAPAAH